MQIDRLTVENFKGFTKRTFAFGSEFNLLVGENGSGKSSALQTVALALSQIQGAITGTLQLGPSLSQIRHQRQGENGAIRFERQFPFQMNWSGMFRDERISCQCLIPSESSIQQWFNPPTNAWGVLHGSLSQLRVSPDVMLPLLALYPANRSKTESVPQPIQWQPVMTAKPQRFDGYLDCLTASAQAQAFVAWLAREQIIGLQEDGPTRLFRVVERAVCGCLPGATGLLFVVKEGEAVIRMGAAKDLLFTDLSDGQRSLVAMAADMAIRAAQLNGHLGDGLLAETPGIVLIDELDLHLHPRWQRRVVADLRRVFPKVQFIATTHSPQIIGEVSPEQILVLTRTGNQRVVQSFGLDSNAVLEEIMDSPVRNEEVKKGLTEVDRLIEADDLAGAKAKIAQLTTLQHGSTAPLVGAQALVDQIEMLADEMTPAAG